MPRGSRSRTEPSSVAPRPRSSGSRERLGATPRSACSTRPAEGESADACGITSSGTSRSSRATTGDDDVRRDARGVAFARRARIRRDARRRRCRTSILRRSKRPRRTGPAQLVPLRNVAPEDVYEVDLITTEDVPATDAVDGMPFEEWLDTIWRRPTSHTTEASPPSSTARLASFTLLAANAERGRAFTEYTASPASPARRRLAERVKRASLQWAAGERTSAPRGRRTTRRTRPMLAVNEAPRLRDTAAGAIGVISARGR